MQIARSAFRVREAAAGDALRVLEIAQAVQEKLTRTGSVQQIAGYSSQNVSARIERRELFVLEVSGAVIGSAFVEPVTPHWFCQDDWDAAPAGCPAWFLSGLVVEPHWQGQGWGYKLLNGIRAQKRFASPAVLTLDCWAGNDTLRRFYANAGFTLLGEFPEDDYWVAAFGWTAPSSSVIDP